MSEVGKRPGRKVSEVGKSRGRKVSEVGKSLGRYMSWLVNVLVGKCLR